MRVRFKCVYDDKLNFQIWEDTITGVKYLKNYNGGLCVLVDKYNSPITSSVI